MSGEASEQREKMADGACSLFREHGEYKLENHLIGPSCLAVVFTMMGLSNNFFFPNWENDLNVKRNCKRWFLFIPSYTEFVENSS